MRVVFLPTWCVCVSSALLSLAGAAESTPKIPGSHTDTPIIPGTTWHVHDPNRPQPPRVTGTYKSVPPPKGALVIFDGKDLSSFNDSKWTVEDGAMVARGGDITTKAAFGSLLVNLEYMVPPQFAKGGQAGNSGIFLMGRYEIQMLNSWESVTYADGSFGAVYGQTPPLALAGRAPGEWNAIQIEFQAPVFTGDKIKEPARVNVVINGVPVQKNTEILGPTRWKETKPYEKHEAKLPFKLQFHGDAVRFRNIWVVEK